MGKKRVKACHVKEGSVGKAAAHDAAAAAPASSKAKIIAFYRDCPGKPFREFSNFFRDPKVQPFVFELPAWAQREGLPSSVPCEFSEKAIMLVKAALMGDVARFGEIAAADSPHVCKALGRAVCNFDEQLWQQYLEHTAYEVVRQKFASSRHLRQVLLSTEEAVLAEAAPNDAIWGIGLPISDPRCFNRKAWQGRNVLGFALMRARSHLRGEAVDLPLPPAALDAEAAAASEAVADREVDVGESEDFLRPVDDLEAVLECYNQYGVVAVTGVLSEKECRILATDGLEPCLPDGCLFDDVGTFCMADSAMNRFGVAGKDALFNKAILEARLHENVAKAFSAVQGGKEVFASHDRFAWMRPAATNPTWKTPFQWPGLHLDVSLASYFGNDRRAVDEFLESVDYSGGHFASENNAKHESMGRTVQGVLNLFDNEDEDGGFQCVPGMFGRTMKDWASKYTGLLEPEANGRYNLTDFGPDAVLGRRALRVPCPAGTLILFDATLPHGTRPNISCRSRAMLFLRYVTAEELPVAAWQQRNAALKAAGLTLRTGNVM